MPRPYCRQILELSLQRLVTNNCHSQKEYDSCQTHESFQTFFFVIPLLADRCNERAHSKDHTLPPISRYYIFLLFLPKSQQTNPDLISMTRALPHHQNLHWHLRFEIQELHAYLILHKFHVESTI